jgi:hypothetical protein
VASPSPWAQTWQPLLVTASEFNFIHILAFIFHLTFFFAHFAIVTLLLKSGNLPMQSSHCLIKRAKITQHLQRKLFLYCYDFQCRVHLACFSASRNDSTQSFSYFTLVSFSGKKEKGK